MNNLYLFVRVRILPALAGFGIAVWFGTSVLDGQPRGDDIAERRLQTGLSFATDGRYTEALTDFEAIVELYPLNPAADNALLEIARVHLEATEELELAENYASRIVDDTNYSQEDAAPEAYVILARIMMARGHTVENLNAALAQLERGLGLWPNAATVPQALFFTGEAHRRAGRLDEALEAFGRVVLEDHESSIWTARAGLKAGVLLTVMGDPLSGMAAFQQVRDQWPTSPEATIALERNSILYRLYVRSPDQAFSFAGEMLSTRRMRRVEHLLVDDAGEVFYSTDRRVGLADPAASPWAPAGERPRGLALDRHGAVTVLARGSLVPRNSGPVPLSVPRRGEDPKQLRELDAAGVTEAGDWLIMDRDERQIYRYSPDGRYMGIFSSGRAEQLAVGFNDQVAIVDRDNRIRLMTEGEASQEIPREGPNYEIDDPVAIVFDVFGHLYVADEERVFIFGQDRRLLRQFPTTDDVAEAPRKITAFALDAFGGFVIADDDDERIVRYR
ncbi:MAG: tetratricopeptide repeat protein [Acidobacteriota bacterium]|nr:tetratricopeptide repeat protein [Acidobacteriota bacterium]